MNRTSQALAAIGILVIGILIGVMFNHTSKPSPYSQPESPDWVRSMSDEMVGKWKETQKSATGNSEVEPATYNFSSDGSVVFNNRKEMDLDYRDQFGSWKMTNEGEMIITLGGNNLFYDCSIQDGLLSLSSRQKDGKKFSETPDSVTYNACVYKLEKVSQ